MNKTELVVKVAEESGVSKAKVAETIDATMKVISEELKAGNKVSLIGFGTFETVERAARTGHNPRTGAKLEIAASKSVAFRVGATLKAAVRE